MCGIAGILDARAQRDEGTLSQMASAMSNCLLHRGPDDSGVWVDAARGVGLGFRRLAIMDLTPAGHQPMESHCSRYVLVFNGEIYNHGQLRQELGTLPFRGHSDTEVMLAAFSRWGVADATTRFNGMFAFAVWDRERRSLTLGRDRMGEKPLYYGWVGHDFLFGSELKALRSLTEFKPEIDRDALTLYLRHGYIPAPHTIYREIAKLPPASLLEVGQRPNSTIIPYWSAENAALSGLSTPFEGDEAEAGVVLHERLRQAVRSRMDADVPLGAFLSGGIDSSLVAALMQAQRPEPVQTFTIGFSESDYDEAPYANAVARHLGTAHTQLYVTPGEARTVIPRLPTIYDEPFADSSQIPTFLISDLARRHVTVALSGDGGDELFGGYSRYLLLDEIWSRLSRVPLPVRKRLASALEMVPARRWDRLFGRLGPTLPLRLKQAHAGDKLHKLARGLRHRTADELYLLLVSLWEDPGAIVIGALEPATAVTRRTRALDHCEPSLRAMYMDTVTYLPDDILTKVDRAAMAVSLETRVPLLDHTLFEFAWRLPLSMRIHGGVGKLLLRRVLHEYVPASLVERPKMGFGVPIGSWLRGPLRDWAEDLLSAKRLGDAGLLRVEPIRAAWAEHIAGEVDVKYQLWAVLMLQAWLADQAA